MSDPPSTNPFIYNDACSSWDFFPPCHCVHGGDRQEEKMNLRSISKRPQIGIFIVNKEPGEKKKCPILCAGSSPQQKGRPKAREHQPRCNPFPPSLLAGWLLLSCFVSVWWWLMITWGENLFVYLCSLLVLLSYFSLSFIFIEVSILHDMI